MRNKNNVLEKLSQTEITVNKIQLQLNRGLSQDQILESIEQLKDRIENIREMISIEPDDFEQQFSPR